MQTYKTRRLPNTQEVIEVQGDSIDMLGYAADYKFFICKNDAGLGWDVCEVTTGLAVGSGGTKKKATENALASLERHGRERFIESMKRDPMPKQPVMQCENCDKELFEGDRIRAVTYGTVLAGEDGIKQDDGAWAFIECIKCAEEAIK